MSTSEKTAGHRVVIEFDDGIRARLICPETGCGPAMLCAGCGRALDDPESKPCYDCEGGFGDECWVKGWFDNLTADELLRGKIEVPVSIEWDGDHPLVNIGPVEQGAARGTKAREVV